MRPSRHRMAAADPAPGVAPGSAARAASGLDRWRQQGPTGSVDPPILALEDEDDRVRDRALALIEQDWAREQAAAPQAEP